MLNSLLDEASTDNQDNYARKIWPEWGGPLADWVDGLLTNEGHRFLSEVQNASHLTDETPLNGDYYVRHRIETVWRIWMTSKIDSIALTSMISEDYDAARDWSEYVAEELDHDRLFLADLSSHGVTVDEVRRVGPFPATRELVQYLEDEMEQHGALPAVAYSLFVEWNSERFSKRAVDKAKEGFSEAHVKGSMLHIGIDIDENHLPVILVIAGCLIEQKQRKDLLERLLLDIAQYFRRYFTELNEHVANGSLIAR